MVPIRNLEHVAAISKKIKGFWISPSGYMMINDRANMGSGKDSFWIKNARLESGFQEENGRITGTATERVHLLLANGRVEKIVPASTPLPQAASYWDAEGLLMLPSFREMHIHLDKTFYGGPWQAVIPAPNRFFRIQQEQELLPPASGSQCPGQLLG
ncbi:hypothetical protein [Brevibacillus parabrevis]|uniref:hypothetical protein n=1 Tax=Brevibacillus parabrevis TaxID=54914 RepID=UPI002EADB7DD|nr:hypothetical protein [Brevibacillus parabrevis]